MNPRVCRIESIVPRKASRFGGKSKNLAALARAGFPVPAAYALETAGAEAFFESALPPPDRPRALLSSPPSRISPARLADLSERLRSAPVPSAIASRLVDAFRELRDEGARAVAVRSSSSREDQEAISAAGLHESVLGVDSEEALLDAVRTCWSSLFSPTALHYLRAHPHPDDPGTRLGIVVQAMVPARVAGAIFTVNPLSGDPAEMVINATYGLGSLLMDGRVSPDTYRVDKVSGWVKDRVVGEKASELHWRPGEGIVQKAVEPGRRTEECLEPDLLAALVGLGRRVEEHFDDARDVEWAVVGNRIYLLQARPVTALARPPRRRRAARRSGPGRDRRSIVWSNVNVGEALPGVASPLTWSVLSEFSDRGFRRAFGALGCRVPRDAELVGSFRGRIFLNLTEFMEIAAQVPGLRPSTLLALGGGGEAERLEAQIERHSPTGFILRLPLTVSRYLRENVGLTERVAQFEKSFQEERARLSSIDLRVLSNVGLERVLMRAERLLDESGLIMLNVYGNLLASLVLLRGVLHIVAAHDAERLERDLLTGLADVDSAAPGLALWHISQMAGAEPAVRDLLLALDPGNASLRALPDGATRRALARFFTAYGYRGAREAEIAEPRWDEDPSLPFATLRAHLMREDGQTPISLERRQRAVREAASKELDKRMPAPARIAARHLLGLVQRFTRLRERLRSHVTQVLGLYRAVALDASRRLRATESGAGSDGAFYLSVQELHAFLRGDVGALAPLIRRRRLQLERDRQLPDPPNTFVGFPPSVAEILPPPAAGELRGLGASGGVQRGLARVLINPSDAAQLKPGEILVAPYADVGWSPLFLVSGAVITELGGPLSHAAVVAREYGVPAVVNVRGAARIIRTGDEVEVDGESGIVRILRSSAASLERSDGADPERVVPQADKSP